MKRLLLAALLALSVPTIAGHPDPVPLHGTVHRVSKFAKRETARFLKECDEARKYVLKYGVQVTPARAHVLATAITTEANAHGFGWRIFAAVLAQESRFREGLNACHGRSEPNCDEGVGQINWPTWGEYLGLDRNRLIYDDVYNVSVAAQILGRLHKLYGSTDVYWWSRYHNIREAQRAQYEGLVIARL